MRTAAGRGLSVRSRSASTIAIAVLFVSTAACSTAPENGDDAIPAQDAEAPRDEAPPPDQVSSFVLEVGDCIVEGVDDPEIGGAEPEETEVEAVTLIDCAEPHGRQVYALVNLDGAFPDDTFPAMDDIVTTVEEFCTAEFEEYVGVEYAASRFFASYLYPTAESWELGDREAVCMLYDPDGPLTGAKQNSAE